MTIRLWSRGVGAGVTRRVLGRLTNEPIADEASRGDWIAYGTAAELVEHFADDLAQYAGALCTDHVRAASELPVPAVWGAPNLGYLGTKDVVLFSPPGDVYVLYRHSSVNNTILLTEQCNSYCLMCSQPPKPKDDSYRIPLVLRLLELIDKGAPELIITGGEPTLFGDRFLNIIQKAARELPRTGVHVLSNGRQFADREFAFRLAQVRHPDLMLGIPLYSDVDYLHDYVVQAKGAFDETMTGLYNLAEGGVRLEVRVVLHQQTYRRLPKLAAFIARNLPFVEHVALMGLEMFGFTPRNLEVLWIDPVDYQPQLEEAINTLALAGMAVEIYNHQLCTLRKSLWPFARKSISDWKNVYLDVCGKCGVRNYCGGFFQSAIKRHSARIEPLPPLSEAARRFMDDVHCLPRGGSEDLASVPS